MFPSDVTIIAHRQTALVMQKFETEKALMPLAVGGNLRVLKGISLRLHDVTYEILRKPTMN